MLRNKIHIHLILWLGFLALVGPSKSLSQSLSLEQCLQLASENSPLVKAKYHRFEAAMQRAAQVAAMPEPTLSFGMFISPVETRVGPQRASLGLRQMFPWFGTLKAKGSIAEANAQAEYHNFVQARNALILQIKKTWYPLWTVKRTAKVQADYLELLKSLKRIALKYFENGAGKMVDAVRVDLQLEETTTRLALLEEEEASMRVRLTDLINGGKNLEFLFPDSLSDPMLPQSYSTDSIGMMHPQIEALQKRIQATHYREDLSKREGMPQLGLGLSYIAVARRQDMEVMGNGRDVLMPSFIIGIPLQREKYRASSKEAELSRSSLEAEQELIKNQLSSEFASAAFAFQEGLKKIELFRKQRATILQIQNLLLAEYSQSGEGFEEVLRMQQQFLELQIAEASALEDAYVALAEIDFITAKSE